LTAYELVEPVPVNGITAVPLVEEVLAMVNVPVAAPAAVGSNSMPSDAVCPGVSVSGSVGPDESVKPVPATVAELTVTAVVPEEVRITSCVAGVFSSTLPNATLVALMLSAGPAAAMVSVSVALPVPEPLVALRVTVEVPAAVGVPEISPVPLFNVTPAGNPIAAKPVGALLAVI
jgi:hypothetical protein